MRDGKTEFVQINKGVFLDKAVKLHQGGGLVAGGDGVQLIAVMVHGHYLELSADKTEIGGVQGDLALHRVAASDFLTSDTVNHSVSSCVLFLGFAVYP